MELLMCGPSLPELASQRTVAEALDTAPGYFETSAPGMRYQHFRSHGLFAGSGAVQVGCIRQRLKLSVMH